MAQMVTIQSSLQLLHLAAVVVDQRTYHRTTALMAVQVVAVRNT